MKRFNNQWSLGRHGVTLPFMVWRSDGLSSMAEYTPESGSRLCRWLLPPDVRSREPETVELLLALLVIRLQAGNSARVFRWLLDNLPRSGGGVVRYPFLDEHLAAACGVKAAEALAQFLDSAARQDGPDAFAAWADQQLAALMAQTSRLRPRDTVHELLVLAVDRGIPVRKFSDIPSYRLGHGAAQQHLWNGFTGHTGHLATVISTHKAITMDVLRRQGFPVPKQFVVSDAKAALSAAHSLGYPVVVKPASADFGTAVSVNLRGDREVLGAFEQARQHGKVLVEQMIPGDDHRLHIVNGRCSFVLKRLPPSIVGDGVRTVAELMNELAARRAQDDYLRRFKAASLQDPLVIDLLRQQGVGPDSVVPAGTVILLRSNSNVSTGGSFVDVTGLAHPDNVLMAERAAKCIGLDHAGVDFITTDIARSWREGGGGICEVNPTPAMTYERTQAELLDYLFPQGGNGRIPIAVIVGSFEQAGPYLTLMKSLARDRLVTAGFVAEGRGYIGENEVTVGSRPTAQVVDELVADRDLSLLVVQVTDRELLANGLNLEYCHLAVLLVDEPSSASVLKSPLSVLGRADQILRSPSPEEFVRQLLR